MPIFCQYEGSTYKQPLILYSNTRSDALQAALILL